LKRLGDDPRSKLGSDPGPSETGNNTLHESGAMIDKHQRAIDAFGEFAVGLAVDLNHLAEEGWAVLVEGKRDETALRALGYRGRVVLASAFARKGVEALGGLRRVAVLTDLDREGAVLASRFMKMLPHQGITVSLAERRRLKHASRGLFLHIENLSRFEAPDHR